MDIKNINVMNAKYVASAVRKDQYPPGELTEIAFIGRSNVGKSSLINSLCRHNGLARTSGTPGKTQTINFYEVNIRVEEERKTFSLVDLPGYGYAKTGHSNRRQWSRFIEEYLLYAPRLRLICQLIDSRHTPMESDINMYNWLKENNLPVFIVATKIDKLSKSEMAKNTQVIKKTLQLAEGPLVYSSVKNTGRESLIETITQYI